MVCLRYRDHLMTKNVKTLKYLSTVWRSDASCQHCEWIIFQEVEVTGSLSAKTKMYRLCFSFFYLIASLIIHLNEGSMCKVHFWMALIFSLLPIHCSIQMKALLLLIIQCTKMNVSFGVGCSEGVIYSQRYTLSNSVMKHYSIPKCLSRELSLI